MDNNQRALRTRYLKSTGDNLAPIDCVMSDAPVQYAHWLESLLFDVIKLLEPEPSVYGKRLCSICADRRQLDAARKLVKEEW